MSSSGRLFHSLTILDEMNVPFRGGVSGLLKFKAVSPGVRPSFIGVQFEEAFLPLPHPVKTLEDLEGLYHITSSASCL